MGPNAPRAKARVIDMEIVFRDGVRLGVAKVKLSTSDGDMLLEGVSVYPRPGHACNVVTPLARVKGAAVRAVTLSEPMYAALRDAAAQAYFAIIEPQAVCAIHPRTTLDSEDRCPMCAVPE